MCVLFCIYYKQMTRWSCIFSVGAPKNVAVAPFILQGREWDSIVVPSQSLLSYGLLKTMFPYVVDVTYI